MSKNKDKKCVIQKGEEVKITEDYTIYGYDAKGKIGVFVSNDQLTKKSLVYFRESGHWGEIEASKYERVSPGKISDENQKFVSRVRKMVYSC